MIDTKHMQTICERLIADRGRLTLLALFERDDWPRYWDLIIVAAGLRADTRAHYQYVNGILLEELTTEETLQITRIVFLDDDNEDVLKLVKRVHVDGDEPVELEYFRFSQFLIRRALIFHVQPAEVAARA